MSISALNVVLTPFLLCCECTPQCGQTKSVNIPPGARIFAASSPTIPPASSSHVVNVRWTAPNSRWPHADETRYLADLIALNVVPFVPGSLFTVLGFDELFVRARTFLGQLHFSSAYRYGSSAVLLPTFDILIASFPLSNVVIGTCQYERSPLSVTFKFFLFF